MKQRAHDKDIFRDGDAIFKEATNHKLTDRIKILIDIPVTLHTCMDEVRFRERTSFRHLIEDAISSMSSVPSINDKNERSYYSMPDRKKKITSAYLIPSEVDKIREGSHYSKTTITSFLEDAFIRYLANKYARKYPNIEGMQLIISLVDKEKNK